MRMFIDARYYRAVVAFGLLHIHCSRIEKKICFIVLLHYKT